MPHRYLTRLVGAVLLVGHTLAPQNCDIIGNMGHTADRLYGNCPARQWYFLPQSLVKQPIDPAMVSPFTYHTACVLDCFCAGKSNPYCEISMGSQSYTTRTLQDTLNPKWNFNCQFFIKDLYQDVLCLTMFDRDQFSPDGKYNLA